MTVRISKSFKVIIPCISLVAFLLSIQYSRSNKMILFKDNVEAISESWYGGDPGDYNFRFDMCYTKLRAIKDNRVNECYSDTYVFPYDTYEIIGNPCTIQNLNRTIFPCQVAINSLPEFKSDFGYCYIMEKKNNNF